ncbi:MAG: serine--tRNA ligase [Candidatus Zambryskibacteria bacterium RIFCSPLOWO2_01_FULL_39_39]|uniref:Serine--tRNA ligase n=1 Tax=Candidatus Zambryskibacteria bacterium RIFCSPLOWO2_01_FULL_39_39 TaxID=1802758 RepID=A0A1G2TW31_9BACT|nr:MAG: Serine-tRNA ligase [Parcubacteria group bacterium GW2011_GWA1_47_10]OHA86749.1 MAG: serine--tRNA ligase [Candidatus Zambryskibacteria bacterium RIFCSPHIGHO2_01_FULL_39_63]OHA94277.1 MAG: serine--tRNA ligase [Candidatus Zambryskibacteria bacterium RIFCSPHIGHO2_02_FULL_39_19]OHA98455.1 MAG: serine--tRNA ligase [Candidatus Zambryskibacteria bacterium RIFCSPHIGHO2_12_FULL_39_21]OHB01373.1 MAG: serine--tRNA ligase [Candidatus Zambryskibacteria bacterium RIFCSPLOWO2_01_FULL_39_39]
MLDIKFIRENAELVQEGAKKKHILFDVAKLIEVDDKRKIISQNLEEKRARQNKVSIDVSKAGQSGNIEEKEKLIKEMQPLKEEMQKMEEELKEVMIAWQKLMVSVPNIPDMSVPEGDDDGTNIEVKKWGEIPKFNFTSKDHIELMENLDLADFETGAKVSGFRGYFLKNEGAELAFAIWQLTMNLFREKHKDYSVMFVPSLVKRETLLGSGYLPQGEDDLYKTQDGEYLSGTAEVATMSYFADKILDKKNLPTKVLAFSPAFRKEAGSYSKDTKGLYRVHEFMKFEQVILCEASHEESVKHHEELLSNAEEMLQALGLPYHVVINCGGDLGLGQVKKYDIETWMPSKEKYGETHSCSYFHDFQTRRLNIKYRDTDGKLKFAHSLNNTAIATPRILIQLVENNQQADGSIIIPEVLRPYMGGKSKIE